jgi:hypothetical protein
MAFEDVGLGTTEFSYSAEGIAKIDLIRKSQSGEGQQLLADFGGIDSRSISGDDAFLLKFLDSLENRGCREADCLGELSVGELGVSLKEIEEFSVYFVQHEDSILIIHQIVNFYFVISSNIE